MNGDVLRLFADNKKLLSSEAKELIESNSHPFEFANLVLNHISSNTIFVSKEDVEAVLVGDKLIYEGPASATVKNKVHPDIKIDVSTDITGNSTTEGKVNDFASYIKNRYVRLSHIIESSLGRPMTIEKAKSHPRDDVKIIGIIYKANKTKNGNVMLTIEDLSDTCSVLISKTSQFIDWEFVEDEVLGFTGTFNEQKTLFFPTRIVRPDVPKLNKWENIDTPSNVIMMSDVHIGSTGFADRGWNNAMKWLKENHEKECINYAVLGGDLVDGIGVYPDQDTELAILDIYKQYDALAEALKEIPDGIEIVCCPGNHDAVRLAEPQPAWKKCFTQDMDSSVHLVGNPIQFELEGKRFSCYHGKGIDQLVSTMQSVTYENPTTAMMNMMRFRHYCPTYGGKVPLCPEKTDYLVMDKIPDVFMAGHVHKSQSAMYNGVRLVQTGSFQFQTNFQVKMNFVPDVCAIPTISLNNGIVKFHDFNKMV